MTNTNTNYADIDSILDGTLDDLADMPEFKLFPEGAHKVLITLEASAISKKMKKPCVEASLVYVETIELAEPEAVAPKAGDTCNSLYMLDNEFGQGGLKKLLESLQAALGTTVNRATVDACKSIEVIVLTVLQKDKKDPSKIYLKIKELVVA